MASKPFTYKGYMGSIEASIEDECLHGKLLFIDDSITYEAETVHGLLEAFRRAVDDYLAYCKRTGKPANKTFSGSFNIRIGASRHKALAEKAVETGLCINEAVCSAIDLWVQPAETSQTHNHWHIHVDEGSQMMTLASTGTPANFQVMSNVRH